jgi:hypothetical protein
VRTTGILRVSVEDGRGDRLQSMKVHRKRIESYVAAHDWPEPSFHEESDVSGHADLVDRRALGPAIEALAPGDVIVFAEHDRAFRNSDVQREAVRRVEAAGGELHCADTGRLVAENGDDDQWFNGELHGLLTEKQWRAIRNTSIRGVREAIEQGRVPVRLAPWLRRTDGGIELRDAEVWRAAFRLRARGGTVEQARAHLRRHGVERSSASVARIFRNRQAIGEASFRGKVHDLMFKVPALIDSDLWHAVQAVAIPRGPQAKSERLLARLGVLRCGSCGARMTVGGPLYNCPNPDCEKRVSITASLVEERVAEYVKVATAHIRETAHAEVDLDALTRERREAEAARAAFRDIMDPLDAGDVARLRQLTENRDRAREREAEARERLDAAGAVASVEDWDGPDTTQEDRRELIQAVIERVTVKPGRRPDRLAVEWRAL